MPATMGMVAFLLACLTVHMTCDRMQSISYEQPQNSQKVGQSLQHGPMHSSKALSLLLLSQDPAGSWQVSGHGRNHARRDAISKSVGGSRSAVIMAEDEEPGTAFPDGPPAPPTDLQVPNIPISNIPNMGRPMGPPGSGFGIRSTWPTKEYLQDQWRDITNLSRGELLKAIGVFLPAIAAVYFLPKLPSPQEQEARLADENLNDPDLGGYDNQLKLYWSKDKISKLGYDISLIPKSELREKASKLRDLERAVAMKGIEEPAYSGKTTNDYAWNDKSPGYYVGAISGIPLFSSKARLESKDGRLQFSAPAAYDHFIIRKDPKDGILTEPSEQRKEVIDAKSGAHLGYIFDEGEDENGRPKKRFRVNAAALTFVPTAEGEKIPYGPM